MFPNTQYNKLEEMFNTLPRVAGIYLADSEHNKNIKYNILDKCRSPLDFLYNFFIYYNNECVTLKSGGGFLTNTNKSRSISEVYDLTLTYFPDYQPIDYFRDIYEVIKLINSAITPDSSICGLTALYCPDIKRPVFLVLKGYYYNKYFFPDNEGRSNTYPANKYFPYKFVWSWNTAYDSTFWKLFTQEDTIKELVGDRYLKESSKELCLV